MAGPGRYRGVRLPLVSAVSADAPDAAATVLELRCYDWGCAFRVMRRGAACSAVPPNLRARLRLIFPEFAEGYVAEAATGSFVRRPLDALTSCPLPLTLIYPHGKIASVLCPCAAPDLRLRRPSGVGAWDLCLTGAPPGGREVAGPWWVVLLGDRPCDLLEHTDGMQQMLARERPPLTLWRPGRAPVAAAPAAVVAVPDSAHNCLLLFACHPAWHAGLAGDDAARASWTQPRDRAIGPNHRRALAVMVAAWAGGPAEPAGAAWPLPRVWDATRWLRGEAGEYLLVARRCGASWIVAGITNGRARVFTLVFDFLPPGGPCAGRLWCDPAPGEPAPSAAADLGTPVAVAPEAKLCVHLPADGGFVLRITPQPEGEWACWIS